MVRLAAIGVGGIGGVHLDNLAEMDRANVVAVCDVDRETAATAADAHDATVYTDYHDLYEAESLDAVVVAVPPFAHEDQELLAAEHGVDLLVEKPLALSMDTAREVHRAVEDAGIVTQVGHMNRYAPVTERARELVGDRRLALVEGHWIGGVPGTEWWRVAEQSGGQVVEQSTHLFDLCRYFAGEVESVTARGSHRVVDAIDFEDATAATMTHENGMVSHVTSSAASPSTDVSLRLVGDGFHLTIDYAEGTLSGVVDGEEVHHENDRDPYRAEMAAFLDAVEAGDPTRPRSPYGDAIETFAATLAVNDSLATGEEVVL
jgi:predicted dehydrogenase